MNPALTERRPAPAAAAAAAAASLRGPPAAGLASAAAALVLEPSRGDAAIKQATFRAPHGLAPAHPVDSRQAGSAEALRRHVAIVDALAAAQLPTS